ncbi:hypothetical protein [Clostridium cuniculi]|uniref:hypothetical protein n=1 Tax=Clostridium cuniculi TaxID=2548455 RepID=UPI0010541B68|nr:hypothetical protein [Clostridium cuniculi]
MNEIIKNDRLYEGYEYKQILVSKDKVSMYIDGYKNFGWKLDENRKQLIEKEKSIIYLKRDRRIVNKVELTRLQRHFEDCLKQINELERSKTSKAIVISIIIGILGTMFITGSTFAAVNNPPIVWLCVLLAIPGFTGWISPYFIYRIMTNKREKIVEPLINDKYEEIYIICEKGCRLLGNNKCMRKENNNESSNL